MTRNIKIRALSDNCSISAAGAIIGETHTALELFEHDYAPRIYFPHKDIATAFLDYIKKQLTANKKVTHAILNYNVKRTYSKRGLDLLSTQVKDDWDQKSLSISYKWQNHNRICVSYKNS